MGVRGRDTLISTYPLLAITLSDAMIPPSLRAFVAGYIGRRSQSVVNGRIAAGASLANLGVIAASHALLGMHGAEASVVAGTPMGVGVFTLCLGAEPARCLACQSKEP